MALAEEHTWEEIAEVERELRELLADSCEAWFPAGSFRRKKPMCADLDVVVIAKFDEREVGLFGETQLFSKLDEALETVGVNVLLGKDRLKRFEWKGVQVDLYIAVPENFVMLCFIRTGSALNNARLATIAKRAGMKLAYADGCIYDRQGQAIPITSERQIYQILGEPWQEPEGRG